VKKLSVGKHEKKEVTKLNNILFTKAKYIMEENEHLYHIGFHGLGMFIDWLEENYKIVKKHRRKTDESTT